MLKKNQYIVTVLSFAILSVLTYFSYQSGKNQEYPSFSLFITIILWYSIAVVAGVIASVKSQLTSQSNNSKILYNFIGTLNFMVSIFGSIFLYVDSGNHFNMYIIIFIVPFIIALVIFKAIYLKKV